MTEPKGCQSPEVIARIEEISRQYPVTVMLVDDQAMIGEAVRRMLASHQDIRYHYCQDPAKAFDMIAEVKPTVILQDLVMPGVDGLDMLRQYRSSTPTHHIPVIVLSSKEEPAVKSQAFTLGAHDYLVKLPDPIEMVARIRHHSQSYINQLERDEACRGMLEALQEAERANTSKSQFMAQMSHELRTPLNAIIGFSQLFELNADLSEEARRQAQEIEAAGKHLLSLVNDLIDLARIEAGKMNFIMGDVSAQEVLSQALSMTSILAKKHGIEVSEEGCACLQEGATLRADHDRVRQVLINLISNAIKYNRSQGKVTVSCRDMGDSLRLSVSDTGMGIPEDKQSRLFNNAFDRLGREQGSIEGTGIGLIITKLIVEGMGGHVGFESRVGEGSTFWLELKKGERAKPMARAGETSQLPRAAAATTGKRLLLVEDNAINQMVAVSILKKLGYEVDVVDNGAKGVAAAAEGRHALVLMDCQMPEMDGFEATAIIRKEEAEQGRPHLPIIAMTANAMLGDRERCIACGMDDYIAKPFDIAQLQKLLATWLG